MDRLLSTTIPIDFIPGQNTDMHRMGQIYSE